MLSYLLFLHPRSAVAPDLFDGKIVIGLYESQVDLYHAVGKQSPDEIVGQGPDPEAPEWQLDEYETARQPHVWPELTSFIKEEGMYEYQIVNCSLDQLKQAIQQQPDQTS